MRALVTGGAGVIGWTLADALVARGDEVLVVDDLSVGRRGNVPSGARLVECDVRDADRLSVLPAGFGPAAVFHLAAQTRSP